MDPKNGAKPKVGLKPGDLVQIPSVHENGDEYMMKGMIIKEELDVERDKLGNIYPTYFYHILLQNGKAVWLDEDMVEKVKDHDNLHMQRDQRQGDPEGD